MGKQKVREKFQPSGKGKDGNTWIGRGGGGELTGQRGNFYYKGWTPLQKVLLAW